MRTAIHTRTRIAGGLTLATLVLALTASVAGAASPVITRQATSANAVFLAYAPPPPAAAKALCLVDSGVNATPDTTPGLVSATALDGGTGADVDPLWHGTIDAAIAGGAGHGVLGAWPQLRIVSVRATDIPSPGQKPTFQFDDYTGAINDCAEREIAGVQIAAIALPLSSVIPPTPDQVQEFAEAVALAQAKGISILAAAGNEPGPDAAARQPARDPRGRRRQPRHRPVLVQPDDGPDVLRARLRPGSDRHRRQRVLLRQRHVAGVRVRRRRARRAAQL